MHSIIPNYRAKKTILMTKGPILMTEWDKTITKKMGKIKKKITIFLR